jgi:thioredoxin-like negative regulator of GroEL
MQSGRRPILIILLWGLVWLSPLFPALAQAPPASKVRPELLEFHREFCPVCKASERVIQAVQARYPGRFVVRKLYIDEAEALFRRYRVVIVPTQIFLDTAGKEVYRHEGVFKEEALIRKLRDLKFIGD